MDRKEEMGDKNATEREPNARYQMRVTGSGAPGGGDVERSKHGGRGVRAQRR